MNKKINWSREIKEVFEYYKNIDTLAENIRNRKINKNKITIEQTR